jgi:hypothetical protein
MASGIDNATGVNFAVGQPYAEHFMTNFFLPVIADARNNSSVWWNMLKKVAKEPVAGRFIVWPIRTTRNNGRGAMRPGGQLSDPGQQGGATAFLETRTYQGRIKIDGELFRRGKTNGGAFIEAQTLEVEGQMDDIMVDCNRMAHNDGSGRIAEVASTTAGTSLVLRVNQSVEGAAACPTKPVIYLEVGDRIGFYAAATDALRVGTVLTTQQGYYVVAIVDFQTIQISATPGGAAVNINTIASLTVGDWVVRVNEDTMTVAAPQKSCGGRNEPAGLAGIFSDAGVLDGNGIFSAGTLFGQTVFGQQSGANDYQTTSNATAGFQGNSTTTSFPWNRAVVLDNGGGGSRPLSEALLQQSFSDAEEQNNANIQLLLSAYGTYNSYVKLLTPDKRYNDTLELKGGHKMLSFNGVPWYKDRFSYGGRVYGLNLDALCVMETEPLQPLTQAGIHVWERLKDQDSYWMGHITSYNVGVTDVRQRVGFLLDELAA